MKWNWKYSVVVAVLMSLSKIGFCQDPVYSSFYNNPVYYNPASPGVIDGNEFHLNFREQWPGIPSSFRAFNYSSSHQVSGLFSMGLIASSNSEGESRLLTNFAGISIAVPIRIGKSFVISSGITSTFGQKRIDWSKMEFDDQFDKLYGKVNPTNFPIPDESRKNYGDLSMGISLKGYTKKLSNKFNVSGIFGAALHHAAVFPNPNFIGTDVSAIPFKQVYHLNIWLIDAKGNLKNGLSPALMYEKQGQMQTFNFSTQVKLNYLYVLAGFRNTNYTLSLKKFDSFIFGFGYINTDNKQKTTKIGYSYDFTVSKLVGGAYGSHEIFMVYSIRNGGYWFGGGGNGNSSRNGKNGKNRKGKMRHDIECPTF